MGLKHRWVRHPGWLVLFVVLFLLTPVQPGMQQVRADDQSVLTRRVHDPIGLHGGYLNSSATLFVTKGDCGGGELWAVNPNGTAQQLVTFRKRDNNPCTKLDVTVFPTGPKVPTSRIAVQLGRETFVFPRTGCAAFACTILTSQAADYAVPTSSPTQCTSPNWTITIDPLATSFTTTTFRGLITSCGDGNHFDVYDLSSVAPVLVVSLPNTSNPSFVSVRGRPGVLNPNWFGCPGCLGAYNETNNSLLVISASGGVTSVSLPCIPTTPSPGPAWVFTAVKFFAFTNSTASADLLDQAGRGVMVSIPAWDEIWSFKVSTFYPYAGYGIVGTASGPIVAVHPDSGHTCTQVHPSFGAVLEDGTPAPSRVVNIELPQESTNKDNSGVSGAGWIMVIIYSDPSSPEFDPTTLDSKTLRLGNGVGEGATADRCWEIPDANGDGRPELKCRFNSGEANCSDLLHICILTGVVGDPDGLDGI